jgi:hypothetical protein
VSQVRCNEHGWSSLGKWEASWAVNVTTSSLTRTRKVHCGREKWKLSSSLTHNQQQTRSVDSEVVVHRIRILGKVTKNREPWSHVSLCWGRKWSPHGDRKRENLHENRIKGIVEVARKHTRTISTAPTMYIAAARVVPV